MNRYILTAAMAATSLLAVAQGQNMVITTTDGTRHVFPTEKVSEVKFNDTPSYTGVNTCVGAQYSASGNFGTYLLTVGTGEADIYGEPAEIGDFQVAIAFTGPISEDALNAQLAPGTYRAGNGSEEGTFDISRSGLYIRTEEGENGVELVPLIAGDIHVASRQGDYTIKMELTTFHGTTHDLIYTGPIGFDPGIGESGAFEEDIDVTFEGAQMRYYGNWFDPFADDATVQLYTGEFDEYGGQIEGYWLNLDMYMPKKENPWSTSVKLTDGTYTVEPREKVLNSTYLPFTYMAGQITEAFGLNAPMYTYIIHKAASGLSRLGLVKEGTITVSGNGTSISFDLTLENGKKLTGGYTGNMAVRNFHDADAPEYPDLESDHVLKWDANTVCLGWNEGHSIKQDVNTYVLYFTEPAMEKGDYVSLYLMTDGETPTPGTYTFNNTLANFTGITGTAEYAGAMLHSWYGDLSQVDDEGYNTVLAPIGGGTVKVVSMSGNSIKVEFDLISREGKKITGVYDGSFVDVDAAASASKKKPLPKKR